ncbi:sensor histidine kinase [Thermogemmatispora sp.]|uniref:sensor histidine kinase n=1 Tax=Thermogemmatispora sp. TaxID=1968838 RepID=UPI001DC405AA|nr:ATP-binding protein [Thermogemmatispora sp.]MBX5451358.1 GAF domain-containing protein [Thermogemmatispora sp.]
MQSSESFSSANADSFELQPPYLAAAGADPLQFELLRQQEQLISSTSLLPEIFRARLFTLLSYLRQVPHCLHYWLAWFLSQGQGVSAIASLFQLPTSDEDGAAWLELLAGQTGPLESWPEPASDLERALLWAAAALLLPGEPAEQAQQELRRLLLPEAYASLQALLAFIQACHLWLNAYPERAQLADEQARQYLLRLLQCRDRREQEELRSLLERLDSCTDEAILRRELELYRRQLRTVLEAIGDSVLLYDQRGRLVYLNTVARRLLPLLQPDHARLAFLTAKDEEGKKGGEAVGVSAAAGEPLLPLLNDTPASLPLRRMLWEGEAIAGEHALEISLPLANGEEAIFSFSGAPVRGSRGRIIGAIVIGREVTARRRLEQRAHTALNALLAMAEALVQADDEPAAIQQGQRESQTRLIMLRLGELTRQVLGCQRVAMLGLERETERVQHVAVTGVTPQQERLWQESVLGAPLSVFLSAPLLERLRAGESLHIDLEAPEFSHLRSQIRSYPVRALLIIPMCLRERLIGVLSVDYGAEEHRYSPDELALAAAVARMATLVLEREHLLEERAEARASVLALREANRRMDEFISFASHELRAPLTVLKANAQLIKRLLQKASALGRDLSSGGAPGEGSAGQSPWQSHPVLQRLAGIPELLDRSIAQVDLLDRLVGDLLDFSRIQSETLQLVRRHLDLAAIVREVVQAQQQVHPGRDIRLSIEHTGAVIVEADAARIGQVLTNYLLNAIRYAPPDRPIEVRLCVEDQRARVLVRDEGPGVPLELQQRIWERFYRAPGIPVQEGSPVGLGLGLHICRTIIQLHGGEVGLESQPGQGATFWFALPLAQVTDRRSATQSPDQSPA